jgi:enoyl-CoA hydratase/carnithine racemase
MTEPVVRSTADRGIVTITLDSPHNRNALSRQLIEELGDALHAAERADARAIVLRHDGPAFCAGADLKERTDEPADSSPFVAVLGTLMNTARPTIAAVDGAVRAGGIGLMAACDLVVVHDTTTFALTEVRIGVAAAIISVPILRRVPPGRIAAAMLTGEAFDAADAHAMGLVTHVTDDVPATVESLCAGVLAGAPTAVAATKRILHDVPNLDRTTAFAEMQALSDQLFRGADAIEGMRAFADKRPPRWAPSTGPTS